MKSFSRLIVFCTVVAFLFSSCHKKNDEGKMVPKNAMIVIHLNTKSLMQKLPWDDIKKSYWYNEAMTEYEKNYHADTSLKKILENPAKSGINLDGGLIFFITKNAGTEGEAIVEGQIKNEKDFEQFNKSMNENATTKTDGGLNILTLKDDNVVAWNDKNFIYAFDAGHAKEKFNAMTDSTANQNNPAPLVDRSVTLSSVCKNLFSLKEDSSLAENEKFSNLIKENGDVHAWINSEEIVNSSSGIGALGMLKLDAFLKGNISTYTVNFENGKIDVSQKGYAGKEFSDLLKNYSGESINTDMIKNIPSQNMLGIFAMNFKPEGIKEFVKLTGMDGFINMYAGQMGFSIDDFVKANKGDIMLALTDLNMKNISGNADDSSMKKPDMNFLFSVSIGDKASFQKLVDAGKKLSTQMGTATDTSIAYGQNDKIFAISNHQHFLNDYLAGNANNKYDFIDKISGNPIGLYVDIHKILSAVNEERSRNANDQVLMDESLKLWNNAYFTGGKFTDGGMTGNTQINFMDQNTNSLQQLSHYLDVIAKTQKEKKDKENAGMNGVDSVPSLPMPPPIDTVGHK